MKYLYISVIFGVSIVEEILFYHVIFKRKLAVVSWKKLLLLSISYFITILAVYFKMEESLIPIIIMLTDYLVGCVFTETGKIENIKYWIISILVIMLLEYILLEFFSVFILKPNTFDYLGQMFACTAIMLVLFLIKKVNGNKNGEEIQLPLKIFLFITPIVGSVTFFLAYMTYLLSDFQEGIRKEVGFLLFLMAAVGVCMAIVASLHIFQQKEYFRLKAELENKYNEQQREYFILLLEKEKETRRFRHDIVNHLICIQDAIKNSQYDNADVYLADILSEMNVIREKQYDIGNEVVNVLLNYYLIPIQDVCDISINGYLGKLDNISQMDMCTIFSNVLKNAVEAVGDKGNIKITAVRKEKFAEIVIGNSYNKVANVSDKGILGTTKEDKRNHGFGLENIQRVIQKNHGKFQYRMEENWFEVEIILQNLTVRDRN